MTDAEFLNMCRLASASDTGGMWTSEKIDAIEMVEADARGVVTRLHKMLAAMTERAQAAEAKLSDIPWDSLGVALRYSQEADAVLWYQDNRPQQEAQP